MIANIGKGALYQMIGIRDNDKKTTLQIDGLQKNSPCAGCPWMKAAQSNPDVEAGCELLKTRCSECKDRCFNPENIQIHTEYIYESRYGTRSRLNKNAILLFMLLHLQAPDATGFITGIAVPALAEALHVHERSIKNNLATRCHTAMRSCVAVSVQWPTTTLRRVWRRAVMWPNSRSPCAL